MKKVIKPVLIYIELIIVALLVLIPISWIVLSSLNKGNSLASAGFFPKHLTFDNYTRLFRDTNFLLWFKNSFLIALFNAFFSTLFVTITAWVMSRFKFKGKKVTLMSLLLISVFPTFLSMTALYTLYLNLKLLNHPLALVIIYVAGAIPYNVWLVKGYIDGIPKDIEEASYIDGCSYIKSFFKVTIPMTMPIMVYCAVSQFMLPWMDFILPNILLSDDKSRTVALGLYTMISGKENVNFTAFAAGAVVISVPIAIVFLIFQKYLVEGISAGANKG